MPMVKSGLPHATLVPWSDTKVAKCIAYLEDRELTRAVGGEVKLLSYHDLYMLLLDLRNCRNSISKGNAHDCRIQEATRDDESCQVRQQGEGCPEEQSTA